MLALALALKLRSHEVVVCAAENYRSWSEEHGLSFRPCGEDFSSLFQGNRDFLDQGTSLLKTFARQVPQQFSVLEEACSDADVLAGAMLQFAGPSIAEIFRIPYFYAIYSPVLLKSNQHCTVGIPWQQAPRWFNTLIWSVHIHMWNLLFKKKVNQERAVRSLNPVDDVYKYFVYSGHQLLAYPPELSPFVPKEGVQFTSTGYWFLDEDEKLNEDLEDFLNDGPPPVYMGFGSMKPSNPERVTHILAGAATAAGQRGLINSGRTGLGPNSLSANCRLVPFVPHSSLFPRVKMAVHHGGAGTTASGLRAGIPQIIVPHLADQFYWGHRVSTLGLGPRPILWFRLSISRLTRAIRQVLESDKFQESSSRIAKQLAKGNGVEVAVKAIENAAS